MASVLGHYSVNLSFSSRNFNFNNAGRQTLPLFHYGFVQGIFMFFSDYWCTIGTSNHL